MAFLSTKRVRPATIPRLSTSQLLRRTRPRIRAGAAACAVASASDSPAARRPCAIAIAHGAAAVAPRPTQPISSLAGTNSNGAVGSTTSRCSTFPGRNASVSTSVGIAVVAYHGYLAWPAGTFRRDRSTTTRASLQSTTSLSVRKRRGSRSAIRLCNTRRTVEQRYRLLAPNSSRLPSGSSTMKSRIP